MHEEGGLLGKSGRERALSDSGVERAANGQLHAERASSAAVTPTKDKRGKVNHSNDDGDRNNSNNVLSDDTTSFILSDGGTRRTKYADIIMSPVRFT